MLDNSKIKKNALAQLKGRWIIALVSSFASGALKFLLEAIEKLLPDNGGVKFLFTVFKFVSTAILGYAVFKVCLDLTNKSEPLSFSDYTDAFGDWYKAVFIRLWSYLWIILWCILIIVPSSFIFLLSSGMALLKNFDMNTMDFKEGFSFEHIENFTEPAEFFKSMFTQYLGLGILLIVIGCAVIAMYIYKSLQYSQMRFIVQENKNISIRKSMRVSIEYMKGHKGELFTLILSFFGWILLCIAPVFLKKPLVNVVDNKVAELIISLASTILFAFLNPYLVTARANFYKEVKNTALTSGKVKPEDLQ